MKLRLLLRNTASRRGYWRCQYVRDLPGDMIEEEARAKYVAPHCFAKRRNLMLDVWKTTTCGKAADQYPHFYSPARQRRAGTTAE